MARAWLIVKRFIFFGFGLALAAAGVLFFYSWVFLAFVPVHWAVNLAMLAFFLIVGPGLMWIAIRSDDETIRDIAISP